MFSRLSRHSRIALVTAAIAATAITLLITVQSDRNRDGPSDSARIDAAPTSDVQSAGPSSARSYAPGNVLQSPAPPRRKAIAASTAAAEAAARAAARISSEN
jgi:hypothetical protein